MIKLPAALTQKVGRQLLKTQKHSPTILFVGGVVGVVATTVLACKATLKLDEVIDEAQEKLSTAKELKHEKYSENDRKQDMTFIYVQTAVKVTKLYGPAILVGAASIAALTGSHNILNKRNAALTAAYAAVEKGFAEYRARVVNELGADKDREFRYGSETKTVVDEQPSGEMKKVKVTRVDPNMGPSVYARFFDELCTPWQSIPEANLYFLKCQQNYANDRLRAYGHLFLNDVYERLGLPHTKAGAVVGWRLTKDGSTANYVDFGVWDGDNPKARDFVNGREGAILLDFNVDGVIFDKLDEN